MEARWVDSGSERSMEQKWSKMLFLSLVFHLAILSAIFFVPQQTSKRKIGGEIYEVSLVEMPRSRSLKTKSGVKTKSRKRPAVSKKAVHAKRISTPKKKKKPIAIAKRTITTKKKKPKKQTTTSSRLLDKALSRIEKRVKEQEKDHIEQAVSRLQTQARGAGGQGTVAQDAYNGITIRLYRMEVENWIKSHWSYPAALLSPDNRQDLAVIVLIQVKSNGAILKSRFKNHSASVIFDQSILKALEMSDPLPPFPEGYRRTEEEIEINFNLSDLAID